MPVKNIPRQVPDLSIIIVNYRGWKRLRKCLDSLVHVEQKKFTFEVIIVDNASKDGMIKEFETQYPSFQFIENEGNYGFANGCNKGSGMAEGNLFLFLNPDTVVTEESILHMIRKINSCTTTCIVSCRQLRENGSEEKSYGIFPSPFTLTGWMRGLRKLIKGPIEQKLFRNHESIFPDWVSGSVVLISRSGFYELGGWDEDFWMYFEDVDLCKRTRDAGGTVCLLTDVFIEHNHGGASRVNPSITALTKTEVFISRHLFISKHFNGWEKIYMQSFLILNNLLSLLIPAALGLIFFYNRKLGIYTKTFAGLLHYYPNCLLHHTWMSTRSVNYK